MSFIKRRISIILLHNSKKQILLQHRAEDAKRLAGYWGYFGGGIKNGESPEDAVKRECLEELSYTLKSPRQILIHNFKHPDVSGILYVFIEEYDGSHLMLKEGQGMDWFFPEEMENLKMADHDLEVIKKIKNKL